MNVSEAAIRTALQQDAKRAPVPDSPPDFVEPTTGRSRPGWLGPVTIAAAAVLVVVAGSFMAGPSTSIFTSTEPTGGDEGSEKQHPGTEVVLVEAAIPDTVQTIGVVAPGSLFGFEIDGHPVHIVYTTIGPSPTEGVIEVQCSFERGSGGCGPAGEPQWARTSSIDNRTADTDLEVWIGLPEETEYVRYSVGEKQYWQTPKRGVAIFTAPDEMAVPTKLEAVGFDGEVLATVPKSDADSDEDTDEGGQIPFLAGPELDEFTQTTMRSCLAGTGADFVNENVPTFEDTIDGAQAWEKCLQSTGMEVLTWLNESKGETNPP